MLPEIPIPGVPTIAEDLDNLLRATERVTDADLCIRAAQLDPSEYDKDGLAHAKANQLRVISNLNFVSCAIAERQHWRRELADRQG